MFKEIDEGRYISLQDTRFYEGCCVTDNLPISKQEEENKMFAERERKIKERELALREREIAQKEKQVVAQSRTVQIRPVQRQRQVQRRSYSRNDCRSVGVCNRSYNFNAVVPDRYYRHPRPRDAWDVNFDVFMRGGW